MRKARPSAGRLLAASGVALALATFLTWGNGLRNGVIFGALDELSDHEETAWARFGADALVIAASAALLVAAATWPRWRDAAAVVAGAGLVAALAFALEEPLFLWDGGPDVESVAAPGALVAVAAGVLAAAGALLERPRLPRVVALAAGMLAAAALVRWTADIGWASYTPVTEDPPVPKGWDLLSRLERILLLVVAAALVATRHAGWKLLAVPVVAGCVLAATSAVPAISAEAMRDVGPVAVVAAVTLAAAAALTRAVRTRRVAGSDPS